MFFDFEKPIQELIDQLDKAKETHAKGKVNMTDMIDTATITSARVNAARRELGFRLA